MKFEKLGNMDGKPLMLVHGMATNGHKNYDSIIPLLDRYCIVLCDVDGHYENSTFKSLDECCEQIEEYVCQNFGGKLFAYLGFSMGGSIGVRLMNRANVTVENVILDAAFCVKMGMLTPVFREMFAWSVQRIANGKYIPKSLIESIMGKGNTSITDMFYDGMRADTARAVCNDVYRFEITDKLKEFDGKVTFWYGSNEPFPKKTLARLKKYLPNIESKVFKGMGHGQFINEYSEEYALCTIEYLGK